MKRYKHIRALCSLPYRYAIKEYKNFPVGLLTLIFVPGFLFLMVGVARVKPWQITHWQRVPGVISYIDGDGPYASKDGDQYTITVAYQFTVHGTTYDGDTFNLGEPEIIHSDELQKLVRKYYAGKVVTVYYDPADPDRNVLELSYGTAIPLMLFGGGLCAASIIIIGLNRVKLRNGKE